MWVWSVRFCSKVVNSGSTKFIKMSKSVMEASDVVEGIVCKESEIPENGMKVCNLGEKGRVLVVKQKNQIYAVGTKCSHYGAPLANGALGEGRVRCPWHGACFNLANGDIEDFPGLDSIPCYKVKVLESGDVKVTANKSDLEKNIRVKVGVKSCKRGGPTCLIIGGGPAGQVCAETLRQEGFEGRITILTADKFYPYDRIKLSKQLDSTADKIQLRPAQFYEEHGIEVLLDSAVVELNTSGKSVKLTNGMSMSYDYCFIATGSKPRKLPIPGAECPNVYTLRSLSDANEIYGRIDKDTDVVVFGSSFIGMEIAAFCNGKVKSVSVVGKSKVPFFEALGEVCGQRIGQLFTEKGVKLYMERTITELCEEDGKVTKAKLDDGTELPAGLVVMGLGSSYCTEFIKDGLQLNQDGGIPVNEYLATNVENVFAGGDVACAPVKVGGQLRNLNIGHWQLASYHGRIAALNIAGKKTGLKSVPFFWTMLFGVGFRYAGFGGGFNDVVVAGDVEKMKFACYYLIGDTVVAVCTVGVDPLAAEFAELLSQDRVLTKSEIEAKPLDWFKK